VNSQTSLVPARRQTRAKRGRPEDLRDILAQVPDAPPLPGDEVEWELRRCSRLRCSMNS